MKSKNQIYALPDNSQNIESDNLNKSLLLGMTVFIIHQNCQTARFKTTFYLNVILSLMLMTIFPVMKQLISAEARIVKRSAPKVICSVRFNIVKDPENYFRESLMLYSPWRNELHDLLGTCKSYLPMYESLESLILKKKPGNLNCNLIFLTNRLKKYHTEKI